MRLISIREPLGAGEDPRMSARALALHRFLFRLALAAANVFAWVFVFQYFYVTLGDVAGAFARVALLYTLSQLTITLATPLSARLLRFGARQNLVEASLLGALAFALLGSTLQGFWGGEYGTLGITAFALLLGAYRALYWLPYESEGYEVGDSHNAGAWRELAIALVPFVAGVLLAFYPLAPGLLLFGAAGTIVLSLAPLRRVRDTHERLSWNYSQVFAELMAPEHRDLVRRSLFEGAFGGALLFVWPIAIFLMLGWSYGVLGLVLSLTFLFAVLARGIVRRTLRGFNIRHSGFLSALLVVSPWILRLSVASPLGVIVTDSYFYTTTPKRLGMDPLTFDQSGDAGYFLDEYTAIKEMAQALGRAAMCAFAAGLALFISLPAALFGAFIVAAFLSLWSAR